MNVCANERLFVPASVISTLSSSAPPRSLSDLHGNRCDGRCALDKKIRKNPKKKRKKKSRVVILLSPCLWFGTPSDKKNSKNYKMVFDSQEADFGSCVHSLLSLQSRVAFQPGCHDPASASSFCRSQAAVPPMLLPSTAWALAL